MARPQKNNIDYFKHEVHMRNDPKVKAVRAKFGNEGYAIYNMLLEALGEANCLQLPFDDDEIEILASDFCIDQIKLKEMLEYFIKPRINLIQIQDGFIRCAQLEKRVSELFSSRKTNLNHIRKVSLELLGIKTPKETPKETDIVEYSRVIVEKSIDNTTPLPLPAAAKKNLPKWRENSTSGYEAYLSMAEAEFDRLCNDWEFIAQMKYFHPGVSVRKTLEWMWEQFWGTEEGWKHKRKQGSDTIDWKQTIIKNFPKNKKYFGKNEPDLEAQHLEKLRMQTA